MSLPCPDHEAVAHSQALVTQIKASLSGQGGWMSFADFMAQALYAPGLGYYAVGTSKFGQSGDFVTAPEMTPLFACALARQVVQIMQASAPRVLEAGAGTGRLAADLLQALEQQGEVPEEYLILELSPDLQARQAATLLQKVPHLVNRVRWLDRFPEIFSGVVLGNELIDAMPVHRVVWDTETIHEQGVAWEHDRLVWQHRPATGRVLEVAKAIAAKAEEDGQPLPAGYCSEIGLAGMAWVAQWGAILKQGALLLLDYGFPAHEFYHPQRQDGTLMCHYRHYAHPDPFWWPGLQDLTAHVDFTALIEAGFPAGLELLGYTSQGQFLLNCSILECLDRAVGGIFDNAQAVRQSAAVNQLVLPHEMGELFKVIAMGKGLAEPLLGFVRGDRSHQL